MEELIYMDCHATTSVDRRVVEAMLPYFGQVFGNAASTTHGFGWAAKEAVDAARESIAKSLGAQAREIVFTSGATESNNLALRGVAERLRRKGNHLVSVTTEHPSVLDPLAKLGRQGFEITLLPVAPTGDPQAGLVRPEQVAEAMCDDTLLVSVMLANNEIGAIAPLEEIGRICKQRGVLLHTDATQAVGKIPVDVNRLGVDLLSFSAHKFYGPKGIGGLYVRRRDPIVRLEPLLEGGGHEGGLRSGTLNVPGIVGMARALAIAIEEMPEESQRLRDLRDRLFAGITQRLAGVSLNGPSLDSPHGRLPGNLNLNFGDVDGESILLSAKILAASTGSACSSADPQPSHVLRALGLTDEHARSSLRFGLGRFNTAEEVDRAIDRLSDAVTALRRLSSG